jgi:hypothetical protein
LSASEMATDISGASRAQLGGGGGAGGGGWGGGGGGGGGGGAASATAAADDIARRFSQATGRASAGEVRARERAQLGSDGAGERVLRCAASDRDCRRESGAARTGDMGG